MFRYDPPEGRYAFIAGSRSTTLFVAAALRVSRFGYIRRSPGGRPHQRW